MESLTTNTDVRLTVTRCFRTLKSSTDSSDIITALRTLHSYLDEGPDSTATSAERAEFRRAHYSSALQLLVSNIQADWLHQLTAAQRAELWDGLFLAGPPEQALLVLMDAIGELRWVVLGVTCLIIIIFFNNLNACVSPLQTHLKSGPRGQHHWEVPSAWSPGWAALVLLSGGSALWLAAAQRDAAGAY